MEQPATQQPATQETTFTDVINTHWATVFVVDFLDAETRYALRCTSKPFCGWVRDAANSAVVLLKAYKGLSDAEWQRRLAAAERRLAERRCIHRNSTLDLYLPAPYPAAVQALLSMAEPARLAVTRLNIRHLNDTRWSDEHGVNAAWLAGLPAASPNLRGLWLDFVDGCLPPPAQLPQLQQLHVVLSKSGRPRVIEHAVCASIAAYLPQLTALSISTVHAQFSIPWGVIFDKDAPRLRSLHVSHEIAHEIVAHAPQLEHLSCTHLPVPAPNNTRAHLTWAVHTLTVGEDVCAEGLARLPQSAAGLAVMGDGDVSLTVFFVVTDEQGLAQEVRDRLLQWRFVGPFHVTLSVSHLFFREQPSRFRQGVEAGLRQLGCLPAGTRIKIRDTTEEIAFRERPSYATVVASAIRAVTPSVPHLTIIAPATVAPYPVPEGASDAALSGLSALDHVSVRALRLARSHVDEVPTWKSLTVRCWTQPSQICLLPKPRTAPYEIDMRLVRADSDMYSEQQWADLDRSMQGLTFLVGPDGISISPPAGSSADQQPACLRQVLQVLGKVRWRFVASAPVCIMLVSWVITKDLMRELHALPTSIPTHRLMFRACKWPEESSYEQLAVSLPACFKELVICGGFLAEHARSVCRGTAARGEASGKLWLCIPIGFKAEKRALVESCVDEEGLGRWVEVDWVCRRDISDSLLRAQVEPEWHDSD